MTLWEPTGKVRKEKRGRHGVRKLPVPGAGWPYGKSESPVGGARARTDGGTEKCTLGENAQNLRHQTDEEVAIWGQRSTEEAPREASRDTSQSSTRLAHSSHLQTPSAQRSEMTHTHSCTRNSQRHMDLEDKDRIARPFCTKDKVIQVTEE